jgi:hypothetical protein
MEREGGLSRLEVLGLLLFIASILGMLAWSIDGVGNLLGDFLGFFFDQRDEVTGELTAFSQAMLGILIAVGAVLVFMGAGWLVLSTNLGGRLAFLLSGAAIFGWLTFNGILFVTVAPRGIRPENLEGLNAFQEKVPAIALTLGSLMLFIMFLVALDRYEKDEPA